MDASSAYSRSATAMVRALSSLNRWKAPTVCAPRRRSSSLAAWRLKVAADLSNAVSEAWTRPMSEIPLWTA